MKLLQTKRPDVQIEDRALREAVVEALVTIGVPAMDPLAKELTFEDYWVRDARVEALKKIGAPAIDQLIALLKHQDSDVRWNAAHALGLIGSGHALSHLERVTMEDKGKTVRGKSVADAARQAIDRILAA
jgi:HEAT repeat protein